MTAPRFEAVTAYPTGTSTVSRFAATAGAVGFRGLVVRNGPAVDDDPSPSVIGEHYDVDVVPSIELDPVEPDAVSGSLPGYRRTYPLVAVAGGSTPINRFAATQRHVDVLTRPVTPDGPHVEPGTISNAIDNDVAIELDLGPLRSRGGSRVRYLQRLRSLWRVVDHYDAPFVVSMHPTSHLEMRGPRHLKALGDAVGIEAAAIERGLQRWGDLVERNR